MFTTVYRPFFFWQKSVNIWKLRRPRSHAIVIDAACSSALSCWNIGHPCFLKIILYLINLTTEQFSTLPQSISNELRPGEDGSISGSFWCGVLFTDTDFWKCSWAHAVMSIKGECFLFSVAWGPKLSAVSVAHRDVSRFSESSDDIVYCRLWDIQGFWPFYIEERYFEVARQFVTQYLADCWTSAHLYFWEALSLQGALFLYPT